MLPILSFSAGRAVHKRLGGQVLHVAGCDEWHSVHEWHNHLLRKKTTRLHLHPVRGRGRVITSGRTVAATHVRLGQNKTKQTTQELASRYARAKATHDGCRALCRHARARGHVRVVTSSHRAAGPPSPPGPGLEMPSTCNSVCN